MRLTVELIPGEQQGGLTASIPHLPAYGPGETDARGHRDLKEALRLDIEELPAP